AEFADKAVAQQVEVANGIENLVLDEFVLVAEAVFVEHAKFVNHDGVVHAAAERQVVRTQELDVAHETEGACAAHFLDEGRAGKVDAGGLGTTTEHRMIEIDLEAHLETVEGQEGGALVALLHCHFAQHTDELLGCVLFFQASRLNQEYEGTGTAVHDRNF